MNVKNPIGLRDGKVVLISDLKDSENGNNCNCVCPLCNKPFIAKLNGKNRIKHFAHSGESCDSEKAFLIGIYDLIKNYLDEGNSLYLPPLIVSFNKHQTVLFTTDNCFNEISFGKSLSDWYCSVQLYSSMLINFKKDDVRIDYDNTGLPVAIVAKKGNSKLAIIVKPSYNLCRTQPPEKTKKYKNYATIEIAYPEINCFYEQQKEMILDNLRNTNKNIRWIYSPKVASEENCKKLNNNIIVKCIKCGKLKPLFEFENLNNNGLLLFETCNLCKSFGR